MSLHPNDIIINLSHVLKVMVDVLLQYNNITIVTQQFCFKENYSDVVVLHISVYNVNSKSHSKCILATVGTTHTLQKIFSDFLSEIVWATNKVFSVGNCNIQVDNEKTCI